MYNEILLIIPRRRSCHNNILFVHYMDGPRKYYAQWNKSRQKRQILYDITYVWNLKNNTNKCICETETNSTDVKNVLTVTKWERGGKG